MPQVILLELNEISFEYVSKYIELGLLPNLRRLIAAHGVSTTTSETEHANLEPWIQWVTAHTGLSFSDHGVFRLGDIVSKDLPQIWETLEAAGLSVGAISPMNAKHRTSAPAFFVPDPWTSTDISAPAALVTLYQSIAQAVNDNAQSKITPRSALGLLQGLARYARPSNYRHYVEAVLSARTRPWRKAMFLDQLLADVFVRETIRTKPNFASLFLNAGAHIQHHYMFSSAAYSGPLRNPAWYARVGEDPVLDVYSAYDRIVGDVVAAFPDARILLATALRQVPHGKVTYYWRLREHAAFLREIGLEFDRVEPRMSRDFLVSFADERGARKGAEHLDEVCALDGKKLFEVDNRGKDLFVMLSYDEDITPDFAYAVAGRRHQGLYGKVAFVALKNGEHDGTGYLIDSGARREEAVAEIPLSELPRRIAQMFGVTFPAAQPRPDRWLSAES
jgi:Type I phosphodiesterase / nucleotide pyrophosphatase